MHSGCPRWLFSRKSKPRKTYIHTPKAHTTKTYRHTDTTKRPSEADKHIDAHRHTTTTVRFKTRGLVMVALVKGAHFPFTYMKDVTLYDTMCE